MTPQELLAERRLCLPSHTHTERDRQLIRLLLDACDEEEAVAAIEQAYELPRAVRVKEVAQ